MACPRLAIYTDYWHLLNTHIGIGSSQPLSTTSSTMYHNTSTVSTYSNLAEQECAPDNLYINALAEGLMNIRRQKHEEADRSVHAEQLPIDDRRLRRAVDRYTEVLRAMRVDRPSVEDHDASEESDVEHMRHAIGSTMAHYPTENDGRDERRTASNELRLNLSTTTSSVAASSAVHLTTRQRAELAAYARRIQQSRSRPLLPLVNHDDTASTIKLGADFSTYSSDISFEACEEKLRLFINGNTHHGNAFIDGNAHHGVGDMVDVVDKENEHSKTERAPCGYRIVRKERRASIERVVVRPTASSFVVGTGQSHSFPLAYQSFLAVTKSTFPLLHRSLLNLRANDVNHKGITDVLRSCRALIINDMQCVSKRLEGKLRDPALNSTTDKRQNIHVADECLEKQQWLLNFICALYTASTSQRLAQMSRVDYVVALTQIARQTGVKGDVVVPVVDREKKPVSSKIPKKSLIPRAYRRPMRI